LAFFGSPNACIINPIELMPSARYDDTAQTVQTIPPFPVWSKYSYNPKTPDDVGATGM
jgi:hypothetical protein